MNEDKKVIYYYYDEESNRRPLNIDELDSLEFQFDKRMFEKIKEYYPQIEQNYYVLIDGVEFKLS
ncbi:MAG: hypothetical protein ABC378_13190 [Staphylococcus pseudoxylosus]|uniref:hypothetical protein n=1 Tax=Staphylococcus pseudoxylosus TaxID=2282419 RepID=UPI0031F6EBD8